MKKTLIFSLIILSVPLLSACGFVEAGIATSDAPGFLEGIWHGMVAPFTLIVRWFLDIEMYAIPNQGWTYDLGFLLGVGLSIPLGWAFTIISIILFIFA